MENRICEIIFLFFLIASGMDILFFPKILSDMSQDSVLAPVRFSFFPDMFLTVCCGCLLREFDGNALPHTWALKMLCSISFFI